MVEKYAKEYAENFVIKNYIESFKGIMYCKITNRKVGRDRIYDRR